MMVVTVSKKDLWVLTQELALTTQVLFLVYLSPLSLNCSCVKTQRSFLLAVTTITYSYPYLPV